MTHFKIDPLLGTARVLLVLMTGLILFALVMVAVGTAAVLTIQRPEIVAKVAAAGAPPGMYWTVVAALCLVLVALILGLRFVLELGRIVSSVRTGDPFGSDNADRLARMGWLTLGMQAVVWLTVLPAVQMQPYSHDADPSLQMDPALSLYAPGLSFRMEPEVSLNWLVLALVLFVLARVFRHGAALRTDLEGTV